MAEPKIFDKKPMILEVEAGEHWWCACGLSKKQPFCDGSHKTTEFKPVPFKLEKMQRVALCLCKHTKNRPFCDGSHAKLK